MKEPSQWTEGDVLGLIQNQVTESLLLDYKASPALDKTDKRKNEVSKDVSAFANSAGGVIVYGIEEDGHVPIRIDDGYDPSEISKEWLDQVINSRINRRIPDVRINSIALSTSNSGRVIYVVEIPQSRHAPHMAADHKFYKRFNFESVPMEEYEVRDVSRRLQSPDLEIYFDGRGPVPQANAHLAIPNDSTVFKLRAFVRNLSQVPADFCLLSFFIDFRLLPSCHKGIGSDNAIRIEGDSVPVCSHVIEWRGTARLPIWETVPYELAQFQVCIPRENDRHFYLFWEAHASQMSRKHGVLALHADSTNITIGTSQSDWKLENALAPRV